VLAELAAASANRAAAGWCPPFGHHDPDPSTGRCRDCGQLTNDPVLAGLPHAPISSEDRPIYPLRSAERPTLIAHPCAIKEA
jgi:hypothetical protein